MPDAAGFTMNDEPPPETLDESIARLARLPELEYDRIRKAEARNLRVQLKTLDRAVAKARPAEATSNAGRSICLPEPTPWAEPVDTKILVDELVSALRRHMVMAVEAAIATALWIVHTWVFERFDRTPRLAITSPTKRCGKSTLLEILQVVCRRPLRADSISASGVFRTVEALSPVTLLVDEADTFLSHNEELRGILNSGFARDGQVVRVVETRDGHGPAAFGTFAPTALAAIKAIPDTVADRSVPIRLARKAKAEKVTLLRASGSRAALEMLASKLARWSADTRDSLGPDPGIPNAMGDREGDISVVLLSIADHAGPEWGARARTALMAVFGTRARDEGDEETGVQLLTDLRAIFLGHSTDRMASEDMCKHLVGMEERPWAECNRGKPMTKNRLAWLLKPFKIRPTTIRIERNDPAKGYYREAFEDAWQRYLPATDQSADVAGTPPDATASRPVGTAEGEWSTVL